MSPERFREIRKLFETVLERDRDTRAAFLAAASAGDTVLYEEVQKLLIAHDHVDAYMVPPVLVPPNAMEYPRLEGRRIGPYEILREIGHGGMGSVYFAVRSDDIYRKHVAFKVLRSASNKEVIRRFQQERRILASLEHPNIATLLDGGTTEEGLPYFVMEYVAGVPIDSYCDTHRLNVTERLILFRMVCAAVQYAHQKLVVHRDLKPSNILVTEEGTVKLLDFGIAKLLHTDAEQPTACMTLAGMRLMTPEYASPEQVRGEPVSTATDVYSLGVVLYELLTGHTPYSMPSRVVHEIARVICEEQPKRPSTIVTQSEIVPSFSGGDPVRLTPESVSDVREGRPSKLKRRLEGDLDNVLLKTLRKEPVRRYPSVEQLSADLGRHLEGRPVLAQRDSWHYRGGKFIKRNRSLTAAAALLVVIVAAGIAATSRQARIAESQRTIAVEASTRAISESKSAIEERKRAEEQRQVALTAQAGAEKEKLRAEREARAAESARKAAEEERRRAEVTLELVRRLAMASGSQSSVAMDNALGYLEKLRLDPHAGPALAKEAAEAFTRIGDMQSALSNSGRLNLQGAKQSYVRAVEVWSKLAQATPSEVRLKRSLSVVLDNLGAVLARQRDFKDALDAYSRSLLIAREISALEPQSDQAQRELSFACLRRGDIQAASGDLTAALQSYAEVLAIRMKLARDDRSQTQLTDLSLAFERLGAIRAQTGDLSGALENYRAALALRERLSREDKRLRSDLDVATAHDRIGDIQSKRGDFAAAAESYRESLHIREHRDSVETARGNMSGTSRSPVFATLRDARLTGAGLTVLLSLGRGFGNTRANVTGPETILVNGIRVAWSPSSANQSLTTLLTSGIPEAELRPAQYETRRNLAISYNKLSAVYRAAGDRSSSVGFLEKLLRFRQEVAAARPHLAMSARELAHAFEAVGSSEADLGQWDAAEPSYHRASGILELISWDKTSRHEYDWETFEFDSADYQNLAEAHLRCSTLAFHKGDAVLAERYTRSGLSVYEWLAGAFASVDVHDGCARALLTCEPANLRDPKKALEYALRVEKATQSSPSPQFLNTLAMAYFATGQTGEAAREQQKAISLLRFGNPAHSKGGLLDQFETRLAAYRKAAGQ